MAGRHYNDNLLDEAVASLTPGYHGSNYSHALNSGGDPFMMPMTTGDIHYGVTSDGRFTSKMPDMHGYVDELVGFGKRIPLMGEVIANKTKDFLTDPHVSLPSLGMALDYWIPGLGAPFDIADGALYQWQDKPGMAGLAYGSAVLPYSLTLGGKTLKTGADVLGGVGTGTALSAYGKSGLYGAQGALGDVYRRGMDFIRPGRSLVDEFPNVLYPGKFDGIDIPIYDQYGGIYGQLNQPGQIYDLAGNVLSTSTTGGRYGSGIYRGAGGYSDEALHSFPEYITEGPNKGKMIDPKTGNFIDPVDLSDPKLQPYLDDAAKNFLGYKTGPDAFKRAKSTYPHIFDNPDLPMDQKQFDAFIKQMTSEQLQPGGFQMFPVRDYTFREGGELLPVRGHYNPYGQGMTDGYGLMPGFINPNLVVGQGDSPLNFSSLWGHEMTHALDNRIWDYSMRKLLKDDPSEYYRIMRNYENKIVKNQPSGFKPGIDSPAYQELQDNIIANTTMNPNTHPHLYGNFAFGPKPQWYTGSQRQWENAVSYFSDPAEILARKTEMNLPFYPEQMQINEKYWGARNPQGISRWVGTGGSPGMEDWYQYGRAAHEVDAFNPGLLKSPLWNQLYSFGPGIGLGLYGGQKTYNLLNYTTEMQSD